MKIKVLLSLLVAGTLVASAQSQGYKDGIEYYKVGQEKNARTILEKTLNSSDTDLAEANYYLGQIEFNEGNTARAQQLFEAGVQANAANPYNYVGLGAVALKNNDAKGAEAQFKQALSLAKKEKNHAVTVAVARAYYKADAALYAKEIAKYIAQARKDSKLAEPTVYVLEGDMKADTKEWGDAASSYEMAMNYDADNIESNVKFANAYFHVNPNLAIKQLEDLLAKHPNSALAQRELAEKYYDGNHWKKAADQYGRYMNNPNHFPEDEARYSVLLYYGEKYEPSLEVANSILAANPQHFLMQRLRFLNEEALGQHQAAADHAAQFFAGNPGAYFTTNDYTTYAEALTELGQDSLAVVQYELAVQADPENGELLKNLSSVYNRNGQYTKSAEAYEAYLKLQDNPSVNDLFGITGRYLNAAVKAATPEEREGAAQRGLDVIDQVIARADANPALLQRKARLYVAKNGNKPDQDAIDTYKQMTDLLDQNPANMDPANADNNLAMYKEAYSFGILYYGNINKDKDLNAQYTEKFNTVNALLNPTAE